MNITATGTSSLTALQLQQLLAGSGAAAATGATSDESADADLLSISAVGQQASAQGTDPFQTDLASLATAVKSGDLDAAKKAYAKMAAQMAKHGDLPSDFKAIGTALDAGDLNAAASAMATVQTNVAAHQPSAAGANPLKRDMDQLGDLITSGDTSAAQSLLQEILARLTGSASATGSGAVTASTSTGTSSGTSTDAFKKAVDDLTKALGSGDTTSAATAYQELLAQLQAGGGMASGSSRSLESIAAAAYQSSANLA